MSDWRRPSKSDRENCPVCGKPDYCSLLGPVGAVEAAVCMRVESTNQRANGGWYHKLRDSTNWTVPPMNKPAKVYGTVNEAVIVLEETLGPRTRIWKYLSAAGDPVGVIARWNRDADKEIRPVSRVAGGWVIGAIPEPRPLYDLPAVIKSPAVFVVEGETAADSLREMGLSATTSAGGSKAAAKSDWSPLAGKTVVLWPDNDQPGEKYIADVVAKLSQLSPRPKASVIRPAGLPAKGDAADWVAAGGSNEQLEKLVIDAEPVVWPAELPKQGKQFIDLTDAAQSYIDRMMQGHTGLISLGIPELDYAVGGGVSLGEMVIAAARPSHGKSALALQSAHSFTAERIATLFISEEMSALALGKRTLQWASDIPVDRWQNSVEDLRRDLADYKSGRAKCIIAEPCGTIDAVVEAIERAVGEHGVQAVAIDYAQLLRGRGNSKYEQVSHVSNTLRETATRLNLLMLVLCQLNREVEKRTRFIPTNADIRDSGSLEQDADVILLLAWPNKVDPKQPANQYQIFVSKNRNRAINQPLVVCRFDPPRQKLSESTAREQANYCSEFENEPSFDPFAS